MGIVHETWSHGSRCAAYSSDAVYLYSTLDDVTENVALPQSSIVRRNRRRTRKPEATSNAAGSAIPDTLMEQDIDRYLELETEREVGQGSESEESTPEELGETETEVDEDEDNYENPRYYPGVPIVYPRRRFPGACNVETVKDGEGSGLSCRVTLTDFSVPA